MPNTLSLTGAMIARRYESRSEKKKGVPNIPRKRNSKIGNGDINWCLYKYRHLVENVFARLKHYRSVATRYDKLARNYASTLALACCLIWLPMWVGGMINSKDQQAIVK